MSKLSTDPYKGVRDFYPAHMRFQKWLFDKWRKTLESFGYVEYSASILEPSDLYKAKTSEEIVNEQTYSFKDRGDRDVTLRPEMTPTVARMVASQRRELGFPLRWYSIPNVFRYEQPQKGRLREHWQLNYDLFGIEGVEADAEVIQIAYNIMKSFGSKDSDFEIRISNRNSIFNSLKNMGVQEDNIPETIRAIDKKEKREILEKTLKIKFDDIKEDSNITNLFEYLRKENINNIKFDNSLVRGFDYYTGMIFEVFDTSKDNNRSLFGGGRYDNLTSLFSDDKVPAVGCAMGDVTAFDFLNSHKLLPSLKSETNLTLLTVGEVDISKISTVLRKSGLNIATDTTNRKVGDKIRHAEKNSIPFVIVIGEDEIKNNSFSIKNLSSGKEVKCALDEIAGTILS